MSYKKNLVSMDGNTAAAHVGYAFSDVAAIYPITPSSPMGEHCDAWASQKRKNIFGQVVKVAELQSEAGASGAVHGSLVAGAFTTTYTASQGLLLMLPNMNKISGELLPTVFHIAARSVATHALSIFGDHSDVMHARPTGFSMIASGSVQEVMDLALVSHLATIETNIPFIHFFDGFRTSHEIQKIETISYESMKDLVNFEKVSEFRERAMRPENPQMRGTAQNPDIFFQNREAANLFYDEVPIVVEEMMKKVHQLTGREYHLFDYVGHPEAERLIILMGSGTETAHEYVDAMVKKGDKIGVLKVRLYRPWSSEHLLQAIPGTVKKIAVLDRTKEPGASGEPLFLDVCSAFFGKADAPKIVGGRYGLSSKEFTPGMIHSVFENLKSYSPKHNFTVGIEDDISHLSLNDYKNIITTPKSNVACKFFGLGSDGTVGANKNSIKIIGDNTDNFAQGYFKYDSKKSGGITVSHLRFGPEKIRSTYLVNSPSFVAVHNPSFLGRYDVLEGIKEGGTFLLNSPFSKEEAFYKLPIREQQIIIEKKLNFYTIDAVDIASEIGLGQRINMIMQTAFFKLSGILEENQAIKLIKDAIKKTYGKKGDDIVEMNYLAVDKTLEHLIKVDIPEKTDASNSLTPDFDPDVPEFVNEMVRPVAAEKGDELPVSLMPADGVFPTATSQFEKRGVAVNIPIWQKDNCIQCNQCAFSCPHGVIRPYLFDDEVLSEAPQGFETIEARKPYEGNKYKIQISPLDCTGCGVCADVCPTKEKSLIMDSFINNVEKEKEFYKFAVENCEEQQHDMSNIKSSQFCKPYFEFSGACAGCGETPYIKLVTQLCGDRMVIANATGCSSIYGGTAPTSPYCVNDEGFGPAWANSLFEDNAEYGFGMKLASDQLKDQLVLKVSELVEKEIPEDLKNILKNWLENFSNVEETKKMRNEIEEMLHVAYDYAEGETRNLIYEVLELKDYFVKKSIWIIGGDGWAYDIGYGGVDHVIASGADVNILVLDTEVYSNTGGQASKATPLGSTAKFAAAGKPTSKKDLGLMAMSYGYVYVASCAMGANRNQVLKAFKEAENYNGPSIVICYSPCINHGIDMSCSQSEQQKAVDSGYWLLYRYDPRLKSDNKNPLQLDSKEPKSDFREFIEGEIRYRSLKKLFPEDAERLFNEASKQAKERFNYYKKLSEI
jgi:pyruvate-ferredoxin/flavodoxin oxidoreductase